MKAYVLMWGDRVCDDGGIAFPVGELPMNPGIWFDINLPMKEYGPWGITAVYNDVSWWLLELDLEEV